MSTRFFLQTLICFIFNISLWAHTDCCRRDLKPQQTNKQNTVVIGCIYQLNGVAQPLVPSYLQSVPLPAVATCLPAVAACVPVYSGARLTVPPCLCRRSQRSGQTTSFLAEELVPGDVVHFSVGDRVPADIRLVQVSTTAGTGEGGGGSGYRGRFTGYA